MKYLILIYRNPQARQVWETLPEEQRAAGFAAYAELDEELAASGELIVSEALAGPEAGRRVRVAEGRTITSDGPFAESAEVVGGFYVLRATDRDAAVAVARQIPAEAIELRPIMEVGG